MLQATMLGLVLLPAVTLGAASVPSPHRAAWLHNQPPGIRIWTSHGEVYRRGERVTVFFRTELDAFVTILRVDTDGRIRVLFPRQPWEDNFVAGGRTYDVANYGHDAFVVDDYPGIGYVFAVASRDPFVYDPWISDGRWDLYSVGYERVTGDPYVTLEETVGRILPPGYPDYDTHLLPYYVERRYDYPRFVCYDCHAYTSYTYWNPYLYRCSRFALVIYTDPFYFYPSYWYPTRYYGTTRVVYVRPGQRDSRYVFKPRESLAQPAIDYRERRLQDHGGGRRPADRGVRGQDLGGVGSVPVPGRRLYNPGSGDHRPPDARRTPERVPADRIPILGGGDQRRRVVTGTERGAEEQRPERQGTVGGGGRRAADPREAADPSRAGSGRVMDRGPRELGTGQPMRPEPQGDDFTRRRDPPDREPAADRPEPRAMGRPDTRAAPPREAAPGREVRPGAPRAEPRPPARAEPRAAPRAEPRASPSRAAPPQRAGNPSLVRRRP
jgi:hypothetical protein